MGKGKWPVPDSLVTRDVRRGKKQKSNYGIKNQNSRCEGRTYCQERPGRGLRKTPKTGFKTARRPSTNQEREVERENGKIRRRERSQTKRAPRGAGKEKFFKPSKQKHWGQWVSEKRGPTGVKPLQRAGRK